MKQVMLVDDSADQIELMELAFATQGIAHPVTAFSSGEAAVAALASGAVTPRLILLDVNMPGLDGPATAARIRRLPEGRFVPIVMMSTSDQPGDVRRAREAGADGYVQKPLGRRTWSDVLASVAGYWLEADLGFRA